MNKIVAVRIHGIYFCWDCITLLNPTKGFPKDTLFLNSEDIKEDIVCSGCKHIIEKEVKK
jgi:hypothetical protein